MKTAPGAELACRAHNADLPVGAKALPRGIISYYAAATLADASTMGDWLAHIERLVKQDVQAGRLPRFYQPDPHVSGDGSQLAPGNCCPERP